MDRISYLPQSILHDILSRLHDRHAARTSVLSKTWHHTWSTFPFVFYESRYERTKIPSNADIQHKMTTLLLDRYKFCLWVSHTLFSSQFKGLAIRRFKLVFKSLPPPDLLSLVDDWMKFLCDSGVEVLQLDNGVDDLQLENAGTYHLHDEFAYLPLCVPEAKSLIKLELSWYFRVDQAFLNHPIKFSSLQVLSLSNVYLGDQQVIQNLISSCPLIEEFKLVRCFGLKSVSIHGLPKLKFVYISGIEQVDVDAPRLEKLYYFASCFRDGIPCKINMDMCTNLRELILVHVTSIIITDQWFLELFQNFPLLENLVLEGFHMPDTINISSIQLKDLNISNCCCFEEIEIDAPNLFQCVYHGDGSVIPFISILSSSSQLVLGVSFFVDFLLDLEKLIDFLQDFKLKPIPINLFLGFGDGSTVELDPYAFQEYPMAPPSLKHLCISAIPDTEEWCLDLVTNIFWSCRPSIVSFDWDPSKTLVKIFCEKLINRQEDDWCCSSSQIKCWWHFLKNVKVSSSFRNHKAANDLKTLLEPFPILSLEEEEEVSRFKEGNIKFWLEWQL